LERSVEMVKRYKGDKAKADKLFSETVRSKGYCEAEGYAGRECKGRLECAHIISRRYSATRTDTRNAFSLCSSHHFWFTDHPREFSRFISTTWAGQYYDFIYQRATTPTKVDWGERITFLKQIIEGKMTLEEARRLENG
jgi:hypothetical protein